MMDGVLSIRTRKVRAHRAELADKGIHVTHAEAARLLAGKYTLEELMAERQKAGLVPWKPGQSGNPAGPPKPVVRVARSLTNAERQELIRLHGISPLDFMMSVVADEENMPVELRLDAAKGAAPYVHRKMPLALEGTTPGAMIGGGIVDVAALNNIKTEDLHNMLRVFAQMGLLAPEVADQFK